MKDRWALRQLDGKEEQALAEVGIWDAFDQLFEQPEEFLKELTDE